MDAETFDLAIVGAGPAGLAAAVEARAWGLSVVLLDEQPAAGGQIYRGVTQANTRRMSVLGQDYTAGQNLTHAFERCGALHINQAAVWNVGRDMQINYLREGADRVVRARHIILASGAMERPFPIPGWTLPGVMGAGAAQILYKNAGALPCEPVVMAGCGPLLYLLANQYLKAGVTIKAIVHTTRRSDYLKSARHFRGALGGWRELRKGMQMLAQLRHHGVAVYAGAQALAVEGQERAQALCFKHKGRAHRIESSLILLHQGVVPNTQFSWALRARHMWSESQLCWLPETTESGQIENTHIYLAGDSRGIVGAKASATQGRLCALDVAANLHGTDGRDYEARRQTLQNELRKQISVRLFLETLYRPPLAQRVPEDDSVIVCRCEEVTAGQIRQYTAVGCQGPNQTKAFGRCGMGPCQGRLCGLTVTEMIAKERGVTPAEVGYYRVRPPIKPVTIGELSAGD